MPDIHGMLYDWEIEITCPECGGEGQYEVAKPVVDYVNGGYYDSDMEECEVCGGSGEIIIEKEDEDDA